MGVEFEYCGPGWKGYDNHHVDRLKKSLVDKRHQCSIPEFKTLCKQCAVATIKPRRDGEDEVYLKQVMIDQETGKMFYARLTFDIRRDGFLTASRDILQTKLPKY